MLREAGAVEVHLRISSPPSSWPCFYGIDIPDRDELVAAQHTVPEIAEYLGVDSLEYLSLDNLVTAIDAPGAGFCTACLTGEYPVPVPVRLGPTTAAPACRLDLTCAEPRAPPRGGRGRHRRRRRRRGPDPRPRRLHGAARGARGDRRFRRGLRLRPRRYTQPVLVSSTDGVGTKSLVAAAAGRYDTIGIDLVAMCVDDIVCVGAEPLFLLDYVSTGKLDPEQMEQLVAGRGGRVPDSRVCPAGWRDGRTPRRSSSRRVRPGRVRRGCGRARRHARARARGGRRRPRRTGVPGSALQRLHAGPPRPARARRAPLDDPAWAGADHTLADELLRPSVDLRPRRPGGGPRRRRCTPPPTSPAAGSPATCLACCRGDADAVVDGSWAEPRVFAEIRRLGGVDEAEMTRVFNLGIGMVLVVSHGDASAAVDALAAAGCEAVVMGRVTEGRGEVHMEDRR